MEKKNYKLLGRCIAFICMVSILTLSSCKKDDPDNTGNPIASYQYQVSETNSLEVSFMNFSQNATSYSWNFGDSNTSSEESPTHVYETFGTYTVVLTASNATGASATFSQTIQIQDPNSLLALLAGDNSKTWKLFREGASLGVGPDAAGARSWWSLSNNGARPCVYYHEFTFTRDGEFIFDDNGAFWGEEAIFAGTSSNVICFEAIPGNMINRNGVNVSAWLSGTHAYTYNPSQNQITLTGNGAWMGLPQLGTSGESLVPEPSRTFSAVLEEREGYDLLTISYFYEDGPLYWDFTYVSYSNPALEPNVVTEEEPFGEDLPDYAPTEFFNTFNSTSETDVKYLIPTTSAATVNVGVDDPTNPESAKVGEYRRGTELFSDLQFRTDFDIQFDNFSSFSIDIFIPSSTVFSEGGMTKNIQVWIADASQTEQFWTSWVQYDVPTDDIVVGEWKTYTFELESPNPEGSTGTPKTRTDLDNVGLIIGGSNHSVDGTFYIRNFIFN